MQCTRSRCNGEDVKQKKVVTVKSDETTLKEEMQ
jgi:hypothetical protein